jgi:chemotaxis protein MotB
LEVVSFETNSPNKEKGVWRLRRNSLAWYGRDVNNIVFKIKYRAKNAETARALRASLNPPQNGSAVTISSETSEVKVVLSDQVLFPSEGAMLSDTGRQVLDQLASSLKTATENHFIVEGHTDSSPLTGALAKAYPSKWELSSARSLAVIRHLQKAGIAGDRLESRAYGEFQPIASDDTPEGRAENRRIEIRIISTR